MNEHRPRRRPILSAAKCRPKIAVYTEVRFMIRWGGASNEGGVGFLAIFDQYVAIHVSRDRTMA